MPAELRRSLGYRDLVLYGLAYIAPFAPLATLGYVWTESNGLIVLAYVLGGICMYFTARSYATMSDAVPSAGSVYGFARDALGPYAGFLAGWMILLDYLLIPAFVYLLMAVALEALLPGFDRAFWVLVLVVLTTAINWFGITVTSRVNLFSVAYQVVVLTGLAVLGLFALRAGKGNGALTVKPLFDWAAFDARHLFTATSICIMSFLGFDAVSTLAEEVQGSERAIVGRAIVAVLLLATGYFVCVTWVFGNLLPGLAIHDLAATQYELASWAVGPWAASVLAWSYATVVGLTNALPMQVGVARVVFAMARDGELPRALAAVHARWRTPHRAMLGTASISLVVAWCMRSRLDELASIVNFGALGGFLCLHVSVLVKFARAARSRHWMTHWCVPICGIAVVLAVLSGMSVLAARIGFSWLAGGVLYGAWLRRRSASV